MLSSAWQHCSTCRDATPLSARAHAAKRFLTFAAKTLAAWSFQWCHPSLILSKCSMCRKMQFDSLSSLPHAQSPHTSCLLANGLSASAEQRNKFFSAHSRLGLSWVCLLGVLSKQQAFPSCRIPLVFAGLQLPCQSLKQMEEWIGL